MALWLPTNVQHVTAMHLCTQTRGKFGLGAKMALIWSKMTTGLPFDIRSARPKSATVSHYVLDIDINK
jgi:DNA topoisomerase VI subunit B